MRNALVLSAAALLAACASNSASSSTAAKSEPLKVENTGKPGQASVTRRATLTAKVTALDIASRQMTVQGTDGSTETFVVDPGVKRLNEISVGDNIVVQAEQSLVLEYQPPGTADVEPKAAIAGATGAASTPPAGAAVGAIQGTVVVTSIDSKKRVIDLKGPNGGVFQVTAGPSVQLERLKVGDKLLATYLESIAIGVDKSI